jgi:hypothetical protein
MPKTSTRVRSKAVRQSATPSKRKPYAIRSAQFASLARLYEYGKLSQNLLGRLASVTMIVHDLLACVYRKPYPY